MKALLVLSVFAATVAAWQWNETTAYRYIWYTNAVSCCNKTIQKQKWDCGTYDYCDYYPPASTFTPWSVVYTASTDGYAVVGYNAPLKEIAVIFRGSKDPRNFMSDAGAIIQQPWKPLFTPPPIAPKCVGDCKVGSGFQGNYHSLAPSLFQGLTELLITCSPNCPAAQYKIAVIGHSLGGAAASMFGVDLMTWLLTAKLYNPVSVYTYGEPRVGNSNWATYQATVMGPNIYRIVNAADMVPHKPNQTVTFKIGKKTYTEEYTHEVQEVWQRIASNVTTTRVVVDNQPYWRTVSNVSTVNITQNYTICSASNGEDPKCSDSVTTGLNVKDHNMYMGVPCCNGATLEADNAQVDGVDVNPQEMAILAPFLIQGDYPGGEAAVRAYRNPPTKPPSKQSNKKQHEDLRRV